MRSYPPGILSLFILSFTRPELRLEGLRAAEVTYRPLGRMIPFWRAFLIVGLTLMLGILIWGDVGMAEEIPLVLAIAGVLGLFLADRSLPWYGSMRMVNGAVILSRETASGRVAAQWREPLAAYRGLRPWREDWTEESRPIARSGTYGDVMRSFPIRLSQTRLWLFLEHATDPSRSLPLLRVDGPGGPSPEMLQLASHMELEWLDEMRVDRRWGIIRP